MTTNPGVTSRPIIQRIIGAIMIPVSIGVLASFFTKFAPSPIADEIAVGVAVPVAILCAFPWLNVQRLKATNSKISALLQCNPLLERAPIIGFAVVAAAAFWATSLSVRLTLADFFTVATGTTSATTVIATDWLDRGKTQCEGPDFPGRPWNAGQAVCLPRPENFQPGVTRIRLVGRSSPLGFHIQSASVVP